MRLFPKIAVVVFLLSQSNLQLLAECWTLIRVSQKSYWQGGEFVIEVQTEVLGTWCSGGGGTSGGGETTGGTGTSDGNIAALATPVGQMISKAKDCVKSYLTSMGFVVDPTKSKLTIQGSNVSNPVGDQEQLAKINQWTSEGSPFTYNRMDGSIGLYWDNAKISTYTIPADKSGTVLGYRSMLATNPALSQELIQNATAKINEWVTQAGRSTGPTALVYLALGKSLGSSSLDQTFLMGHELGHVLATSQSNGTHPDFWIDESGALRLDTAQSGSGNPDTFGMLMAANSKAVAEGTTIEQALRSMGLNALADGVASRFGSGGC